ncbi:uncharacterized protein LOC122658985 [Telopea speciosissima]|uniref:uncharacterized protein LOC122658985 n=1 Tax=Telopea speciosissima TaxID=54955 RepID=UPI001CC6BC2A|nr:uncharacterized protein LOC122658985 [Telopea speciosissima]
MRVEAFTYADWAGSPDDRRSTSGYYICVGGNLSLLQDRSVSVQFLMMLYCDSKLAISIAHNPIQHDKTKHMEIDCHLIKEKLEQGVIYIPFVKSSDLLVDVFTKRLSSKNSVIKNVFDLPLKHGRTPEDAALNWTEKEDHIATRPRLYKVKDERHAEAFWNHVSLAKEDALPLGERMAALQDHQVSGVPIKCKVWTWYSLLIILRSSSSREPSSIPRSSSGHPKIVYIGLLLWK